MMLLTQLAPLFFSVLVLICLLIFGRRLRRLEECVDWTGEDEPARVEPDHNPMGTGESVMINTLGEAGPLAGRPAPVTLAMMNHLARLREMRVRNAIEVEILKLERDLEVPDAKRWKG
jgi:hypothetical protein